MCMYDRNAYHVTPENHLPVHGTQTGLDEFKKFVLHLYY